MTSSSWIFDPNGRGFQHGGWRCSKCRMVNNNIGGHGKIDPLTFIGSKFCPHCGKRADGKEAKATPPKLEMGGATMEKLNTVQMDEKINEIYRVGEMEPDGAYDTYAIVKVDPEEGENPIIATVKFQKGARGTKTSRHGVLGPELIEIVLDRLKTIQLGKFASEENRVAIFLLEHALQWMSHTVEERIRRGILGKHKR